MLANLKAKRIVIRYGRLSPPEWIVFRFPLRDYRVALMEAYLQYGCGKLSREEYVAIRRRIRAAVFDCGVEVQL